PAPSRRGAPHPRPMPTKPDLSRLADFFPPEDVEWKASPVYGDRYLVSDHGHVLSLPRFDTMGRYVKGRFIRARISPGGYAMVTLKRDGERTDCYVHALVCEAFHGPAPG